MKKNKQPASKPRDEARARSLRENLLKRKTQAREQGEKK